MEKRREEALERLSKMYNVSICILKSVKTKSNNKHKLLTDNSTFAIEYREYNTFVELIGIEVTENVNTSYLHSALLQLEDMGLL